MKSTLSAITVLLVLGTCVSGHCQDAKSDRLKQWLERFPDADANKDGKLSEAEALGYASKKKSGKKNKKAPTEVAAPSYKPTVVDEKYGPHERNVLDFWKASSSTPTPLVVFIHGGGFTSGDKSKVAGDKLIQECLDAGVSFAAINYRYRTTAPIQDVLRDCARAVQYLRFKATDWNIDATRVATYGGSAGAGTSLWLAFHDDLADPQNSDPVLRQSTRIACAGSTAGQFSYDIVQWVEAFGEDAAERFGDTEAAPMFYGFKTHDELTSEKGIKIRSDCDMLGLISKGDAPVFLTCNRPADPIEDRGAYLHHPKHSKMIYDRCCQLGVEAVADLPGFQIKPPADGPGSLRDFLFANLKVPAVKQ